MQKNREKYIIFVALKDLMTEFKSKFDLYTVMSIDNNIINILY